MLSFNRLAACADRLQCLRVHSANLQVPQPPWTKLDQGTGGGRHVPLDTCRSARWPSSLAVLAGSSNVGQNPVFTREVVPMYIWILKAASQGEA